MDVEVETETEVGARHTTHIPTWKIDEVKEIKDLTNSHNVVGVVGIRGITAKQLQSMRANLSGGAKIKMCRNNLIKIAFDGTGAEKLSEFVEDQTVLMFTNLNPFKLYKMLEGTKTPAPIKPGDVVPKDILIEKGPTSFKPGPIVGELQQAGIPAGIVGGKVVIKDTKTVIKEGEIISKKLAEMLSRLDIYPMEIGLDLRSVYEDGMIYRRDILAVDEDKYLSDITTAAQNALNLAIKVAYPTESTINMLVQIAWFNARNLAMNSTIFEHDVIEDIIARAHVQALCIDNLTENQNRGE